MLIYKRYLHFSPDPPDAGGGGGADPAEDKPKEDFSVIEDGDKTTIVLPDNYFGEEGQAKGPDGEDKPPADNPDDQGEFPSDAGLKFQKKYAGKSTKELLQVIYEQEQFIGRQATEKGKLNAENKPMTSEQMQTALTKANKDLDAARDALDQLDPVDDKEEYDQTKEKIAGLRKTRDQLTKDLPGKVKQELNNPVTEESTVKLATEIRESYKAEFKAEFKDRDWAEIMNEAVRISDGEKVTDDDIHAAVMVSLGATLYRKMLMGQANFKTRTDIAKAQGMTVRTIGDGVTSKGGNALDISELSNAQIIKLLDDPKTPYAVKQKLYQLRKK